MKNLEYDLVSELLVGAAIVAVTVISTAISPTIAPYYNRLTGPIVDRLDKVLEPYTPSCFISPDTTSTQKTHQDSTSSNYQR